MSGADVVGGIVVVAVVGGAVVGGAVVAEVTGSCDVLPTDELVVADVVFVDADPVGPGVGELAVDDWVTVTEASVGGGAEVVVGAGESGGVTLDAVVDPLVVDGAIGV